MLYSNQNLLNKYNKTIPKTWDELIDTGIFIMSEEKKLNKDIIVYTADITDSENGFCSLYEYIYSFRENIYDNFPSITDPEIVLAMKKLKNIKNEFGEYGIRANNEDIVKCLNSDDCLFVKTWNDVKFNGNYTLSNLPGNTDGISGSCVGGYNMGMNIHISEEKKKKVATVMEYISSYEHQQKIMEIGFQSSFEDFYNDDESICQKYVQCQNIKSIQGILRPVDDSEDYTIFSKKYRNYLLKYLYNDEDLNECLMNIQDLILSSYLENSSIINRIYTIVIIVTYIIMIFCYFLAFTKKHKYKFRLLSPFYWFIYMLGQIIIISYGFTGMGKMNEFKCAIKSLIFSVGFTLIVIVVNNDAIYQKCKIHSIISRLALSLIYLHKVFILLFIALLIFTEWNIKKFKYDIHYATSTLLISFISFFLFGMVQNLKFTKYIERFLYPALVTYFYGVSSFTIFFIARFFSKYNVENEKDYITRKLKGVPAQSEKALNGADSFDNCSSSFNLNNSDSGIYAPRKMSMVDHLINLHNNGNEIKKSIELCKNSSYTNISGIRNNTRRAFSFDNYKYFEDSFINYKSSQIIIIHEKTSRSLDNFPSTLPNKAQNLSSNYLNVNYSLGLKQNNIKKNDIIQNILNEEFENDKPFYNDTNENDINDENSNHTKI
ncbi:hypothetical protein LY90DRAFT_677477 [Neocallimastix californiae]|uniref:Periplasmic binding protein-like II n=1 Tax=Neocallimastix californiae TaxID=1754190 RepID=A0A1Y2A0T4_9FUNG|nr:hypothetical protein LY90DRAFT_677477 [Neocallimastix californiae]|eukprot:ORY16058.1 hypothetical protein LY90DRAFT_677477 [Neocallimastix californiae]